VLVPGTTIVSVAPRPRPRLIVALLIALAALASQLVALSDQLLVGHVTCPVDGERVHVGAAQATAPRSAAPEARIEQAALDADRHEHAQCLVDEDVDQLPPRIVVSPFVPAPEAAPAFLEASTALASAAFPIYRLAPKNSPPA
jgi:hypothetical protein